MSLVGGRWRATASPGGLATALRALAGRRTFTWVGWPGAVIAPSEQAAVRRELMESVDAVPVFVDEVDYEGFYEEISNRVLWPLFHNLPGTAEFDRTCWSAYERVNRQFADAIAEQAQPGDLVWVHDYQLTLVPRMLRARGVECSIGFFLHIPFPSPETYRALPVREAVLRGMLGADLIGFHTYEYVSQFRGACLRVLGLESEPESILMPTHRANLGVLPIGIEPSEIARLAASDEAVEQYERLEREYAGKTVIVGVDRLDYTKGLPKKLLAYDELLTTHPEMRDRVVMIQIAAPSRTGVVEYQQLKREMDELAGRINGRHGTLESRPLVYINQSVSQTHLTALYRLADIALVTPLRDGMNLVALEYIAAHTDGPGTLILSEFAGAASCLAGARLINPHDQHQISNTLYNAILQGPAPTAWDHMRRFVTTNTANTWAQKFLDRLEQVYEGHRAGAQPLRLRAISEVRTPAADPVFLLDYDGTLAPITTVPAEARPTARVRQILTGLADHGTVYVVSGRAADFLESCLGDLPIGLVCEHGVAVRHPGSAWAPQATFDTSVLEEIAEPLLTDYTTRTPGSWIERKHSSLVWHYRAADPRLGAWRARELHGVLEQVLAGHAFTVLFGARVVEVRHAEISKAGTATRLLERHPDADFVLCAGDDRADEEMFAAVSHANRPRTIVCHVGGIGTMAPYMVESPAELIDELEWLLGAWDSRRDSSGELRPSQ